MKSNLITLVVPPESADFVLLVIDLMNANWVLAMEGYEEESAAVGRVLACIKDSCKATASEKVA